MNRNFNSNNKVTLASNSGQLVSRFKRASIAPYALPGTELANLNKVAWPIDISETALVIHDMQVFWNDFFQDPSKIIANIQALRNCFSSLGAPVIYTIAERPKHLSERGLGLDMWGGGLASEGVLPNAREIIDELAPTSKDFIVSKVRYSGFFQTDLDDILRRCNRRHIVLTGVFGHHGVMMTAADAYMRGYKVSMALDAVGDYSLEDHLNSARLTAELWGQLGTTNSIIKEISA
jgi:bifunctional isochorismate lyase / aryl carrier protein